MRKPAFTGWSLITAGVLLAGVVAWLISADSLFPAIADNFSYRANILSYDNFFDPNKNAYSGEILSKTRYSYTVEKKEDQVFTICNVFDVRKPSGDPIFSVERLYGIDQITGKHVAGYGDKNRSGYLFAPKNTGKEFTYWHINYDAPAYMKLRGEEVIEGLKVRRYECNYKADQTYNLTFLPGVPKERGVELDINLQLWIEPTTGYLIKYEDHATAWFYDIKSKKRIHPWNRFHNQFEETSISNHVQIAMFAIDHHTWWYKYFPLSIFLLIFIFLSVGYHVEKKSIGRVYFVSGLILFTGFSVSILLYGFLKKNEVKRVDTIFTRDCEAIRTSVQRELERSVEVINSIKSNFISHKGMTREQYRLAVNQSLKNTGSIQTVGWIPNVPLAKRSLFEIKAQQEGFQDFKFTEWEKGSIIPARKRDSYFPIYYIEPFEINKEALGFDLASNPIRKSGLEIAASTGEATASESVVLVQQKLDRTNNKSFLIIIPMYEDELGISKNHTLHSYLSAGINIQKLINEAIARVSVSNNLGVTIKDLETKNGEVLFTNIGTNYAYQFKKNSTLQVANRLWKLQFQSTPISGRLESSWFIVILPIVVILMTLILAMFIFRILTDESKKIGEINLQMIDEIAERKKIEETLQTESAYIKLLQKIAIASNESKTIEEAVRVTLDKICGLTGWPVGHLYLIDNSKTAKLRTTSVWHIDNPELFRVFKETTEMTDFDIGIGLPGRVWESKAPVWVPDVSVDSNFPRNKVAESILIKAGFAFPIMVKNNVAGVLEFFSLEIITEPNIQLLEVAANVGTLLGRVIERNDAKEKLKKEQASLAGAQKIAHLGSWEWDVLANKIEWSDEMYRIYGLIPQEYEANYESYLNFVHPEDKEYVNGMVQQAYKDQQPFSFFHRIVRLDGSIRVLSSRGNVVADDEGNTILMNGTGQDITEIKQAEMTLRDSEAQIQTIFRNAPDAVVMIDEEGQITRWNPKAEEVFGWTYKEVVGKNLHELIIPERYREEHQRGMKHFKETKEGPILYKPLELRAIRKDESEFDIGLSISPTIINEKYFFIGFMRDITEQKKAAIELKENAIRLEASSNILEIRNTQLVDFCSIVSHNLRAPLVNIAMLTEYIDQCDEEEERKEVLEKMKLVVSHLNEVFDELVESVQVRRDTEIELDKIILKDCVNKILIGFERQIESYKAEIQINFDDAPVIYYPQKYIDSILSNLISNALKYKSPDRAPIIKIKTQKTDGNILLSISDNGLGLDLEKHKDKLFKIRKVFHKHPEARGFGLFLIKTQVEALGGKIWAESTPNIGSTFFVEFKNQNI